MTEAQKKYRRQLHDSRWITRRAARAILAGGQCERCQSTARLNVHHKRYISGRMAWDYTDDDLEVLCRKCHQAEHGIKAKSHVKAVKVVQTVQEQTEEWWEWEAKIQEAKAEYQRLEHEITEKRALLDGYEQEGVAEPLIPLAWMDDPPEIRARKLHVKRKMAVLAQAMLLGRKVV